jgi:hypothetical protein
MLVYECGLPFLSFAQDTTKNMRPQFMSLDAKTIFFLLFKGTQD